MEALLQRISGHSPSQVLGFAWVTFVFLSLLAQVPIIGGVAVAVGLVVFVGYPYLIVLGLPARIVRPTVRSRARFLFKGLLLLAVVAAVLIPFFPEGSSSSEEAMAPLPAFLLFVAVVTICVVVFAPFFLATAALNDVRRSQRGGPLEGSITNFVAIYFWLFGGIFRIHPRIQVALHAA